MVTVRMSAGEVAEVHGLRGDDLSRYLDRPDGLLRFEAADAIRKQEGALDGKHHSAYQQDVLNLKRSGDLEGAERLLLRLVEVVEREAKVCAKDWPIPGWHYQQLAIIYKKLKRPDAERAIVERYVAQFAGKTLQPNEALTTRLAKIR